MKEKNNMTDLCTDKEIWDGDSLDLSIFTSESTVLNIAADGLNNHFSIYMHSNENDDEVNEDNVNDDDY